MPNAKLGWTADPFFDERWRGSWFDAPWRWRGHSKDRQADHDQRSQSLRRRTRSAGTHWRVGQHFLTAASHFSCAIEGNIAWHGRRRIICENPIPRRRRHGYVQARSLLLIRSIHDWRRRLRSLQSFTLLSIGVLVSAPFFIARRWTLEAKATITNAAARDRRFVFPNLAVLAKCHRRCTHPARASLAGNVGTIHATVGGGFLPPLAAVLAPFTLD